MALSKQYIFNREFISPWENQEVKYWSSKWGISVQQLNDAIIDTGSIKIKDLRSYLRKKQVLLPFKEAINNIRYLFFLPV